LFSGTTIESSISTDLDLELSKLIPYRLRSFALNDTSALDPEHGPTFTPLYRMREATGTDPWIGRPIVAAEYDHRSEANENAGKAILFSIPFHDGTSPLSGAILDGNGSGGKFISYALRYFTLGTAPVSSVLPERTTLHPAYPNPFNPISTIQYELPSGTYVRLRIYDLVGREVGNLVDGYMEPGYHSIIWNARDEDGRKLPTGIYIARLATPDYSTSIKMVLLK
jgi:hypothetical protein